jgi:hypothetical protein
MGCHPLGLAPFGHQTRQIEHYGTDFKQKGCLVGATPFTIHRAQR